VRAKARAWVVLKECGCSELLERVTAVRVVVVRWCRRWW
jgi:hypothetical protein